TQIHRLSPNGTVLQSYTFPSGGGYVSDIDLASDGSLVAGTSYGYVAVMTQSFTGFTSFFSGGPSYVPVFVAFAPDPTPRLSINDVTLAEGNTGVTNATFTVSLNRTATQAVSVDWATADGTATAGSDYTAAGGTLIFNPGETSKTVTVAVSGDTDLESDETFFVNLSNAGTTALADGQGQATVRDDDTPVLTVNDVAVTEGDSGITNATF